jgi:MFS family permease
MEKTLKWPEVMSLAALNAAVVISWIAYHEYQPHLLEKFNFTSLAELLVVAKAFILVLIPPVAGYVADRLMKKNGKFFTVFTIGIGATAMIFMVVATIIGAGPLSSIRSFLPVMVVLWLVAMNLFISPANSMIEAFAPAHKLPLVMGVLVLVTELIYALEPLVVALVNFFGDTLTFIVGGILIGGTGFLFHKVSSDEVIARKKELVAEEKKDSAGPIGILAIIIVGLQLGLGKALITEFLPFDLTSRFELESLTARYFSFGLLGLSAILAFIISRFTQKTSLRKLIYTGFIILAVGVLGYLLVNNLTVVLAFASVVAVAFAVINIAGIPFAINNLNVRQLTYGVGMFIGSSEVFGGLFEYFLA